jgi:hypothetical protein
MWEWQTCTQFGYFQASLADRSVSVFSQLFSVSYYENNCQSLFGTGQPDVDGTNQKFYDRVVNSATTRIFFTNGSADPWSALSITQDPADAAARDVYTYVIDGGSHATDLLAPASTDSASLTGARTKFQALLDKWLGAPAGQPAVGPPATGQPAAGQTYGSDLFVGLEPSDVGSSITLYVAGDARLVTLAVCSGTVAVCTASPTTLVSFSALPVPAGSQMSGRAFFRADQPLTLTSGAALTVIGWDGSGNLTQAIGVAFASR